MKPIPYGRQDITREDLDAVAKVLQGELITQGPHVRSFEKSFTKYIGSEYAVAVANGTAALHLSALSLNIKSDEKVITTPITFAASANCVKYAGGQVLFADIDPSTYLIDLNKVEDLLKKEDKVVGIIPVDFAGRAIDLEALQTLAEKYGLWIIEDACHAPGGYFMDSLNKKQFCGNGNFADLAIFSFHPVKHIAAGEGGMITTNNKELYDRLMLLRTHGISKNDKSFETEHGKWYYEMLELGFNYRLTDFQAALAESQLTKANDRLSRRRKIASIYAEEFKNKSFILGQSDVIEGHAYHLYIVELENRKGLYDYLRTKNIFPQVHYIPVHLMPYYKQFGWSKGDLPNAEKYYEHCLSLPMYPTLTDNELEFVIDTVNEFYA